MKAETFTVIVIIHYFGLASLREKATIITTTKKEKSKINLKRKHQARRKQESQKISSFTPLWIKSSVGKSENTEGFLNICTFEFVDIASLGHMHV